LLGVQACLLRHNTSGAEVLHLANDEANLTFAVGFATIPQNDTGVAHILEHMVLAGSERFPVKDPFFEMVKGSVAGFINAMTWPDRTVYPFATDHPRDYLNLMNVYLDAVFRPRLTRETFDQEAWHLEPGESSGSLRYRGVVFNEMKGAWGDADHVLDLVATRALLPGTAYTHDSGGDPAAIPQLSYEQLRQFHHDHYHPSRARFVLHGDIPLAETLNLIDGYLEGAEPLPPIPIPEHPQPFDAPRKAQGHYPADARGQAMATVSWVVPDAVNLGELLAWQLLERVLIGTAAAPLRRALLDASLGEAFIGSFSDDRRSAIFEVGLRGVAPERSQEVHQLVIDALARITEQGLADEDVAAARNRIEFSMRELDIYGGQRGLAIGLSLMGRWFHGQDPLDELDMDQGFADLDALLAANGGPGALITSMVKRHLLEGTHRVDAVVLPDMELSQARQAEEDARLDTVAAALSEAEHQAVAAAVAALEAHQQQPDAPEARATLPRLGRADLAAAREEPAVRREPLGAAEVRWIDQPTRGLMYADLTFDLSGIPAHLLLHGSILGRALLETGTQRSTLSELTRRFDRDTGGLGTAYELHAPIAARGAGVARFGLRAKALGAQTPALFELLHEVLTEARFDDRDAIRRLALEDAARRRTGLERAGTQYASQRLGAHASPQGMLAEQLSGLASLANLRALVERIDSDWEGVRAELFELREQLLVSSRLIIGVTADEEAVAASDGALRDFVAALPTGAPAAHGGLPSFDAPAPSEGWTLAGQVNYTAMRWQLSAGAKLPGSFLAATRHLSSDVLIPVLRFQGGAYGAGAMIDPLGGALVAYAYRDPNLKETLAVFAELPSYLRRAADELDDDAIDTLIVGSAGKLDPYALPGATGYRALLRSLRGTEGEVARLRGELLATERQDFRDLADAIEAAPKPTVAVLGPREKLAPLEAEGWTLGEPA
jgi:Zn-dependent M16 (insulinase) family peptidase